ncbi:hypothetical protein MML48_1g16126 [Holotrichia oblita]|uniref:Uncharacterized protein n=1 Tax=Holotrichia oblita TaxID=644536 RepID=A0ACB9TTY3_HOLOL|nr:hypothetical protein MML48_1g16126 [Holotrichia oblita]
MFLCLSQKIARIDLEGKLPYIKGNILSILSDDSGISTSEEQYTQHKENVITKFDDSDAEITHKPKKKKKRKSENSISMDIEMVHEIDSYSNSYVVNHKRDGEITEQYESIDSHIEVRKLKKKKRDKPDDSDIEVRKLKKKKKDRQDNSESVDKITDSDFEKGRKLKKNKLSDKINVDVEIKKPKKRKHKYEDDVISDNVEISYNEIVKPHKKHKHKTKEN